MMSTSVGSYSVLSSPPCLKKPQYTAMPLQLVTTADSKLDVLTSTLTLQHESYHIAEGSNSLFDYEVVLVRMALVESIS